jgi:hypothetical protein
MSQECATGRYPKRDEKLHKVIYLYHETRKGGQGPTLGCSAIDDDDEFTFQSKESRSYSVK